MAVDQRRRKYHPPADPDSDPDSDADAPADTNSDSNSSTPADPDSDACPGASAGTCPDICLLQTQNGTESRRREGFSEFKNRKPFSGSARTGSEEILQQGTFHDPVPR